MISSVRPHRTADCGVIEIAAAAVVRRAPCALAVVAMALAASAALPAQQTRPERSNYTETSTHADIMGFIDSLQARGAKIHAGSIGRTAQGRDLPYVIASRPLVSTPAEARRLGRPVVYVQGNIHSGEVEGKEALQALLRDLLFDSRKNVLDSVVLIAVPDYNADGNENMAPQARNRGAQNGPEMVGTRPNSQNINLNRDYVRAEAPESRASLAMFNLWDPDIFVDLHTTDGSYHGYALTYSPSLHPAAALAGATFGGAFARDSMLPLIRQRMRTRHKFEVFDYGNFSGDEGPSAAGEGRSWSTYEHTPRYGANYYALRGRISILSEAYSHDPFERRVKSTYAFVREILSFAAERSRSVLAVSRGSDVALAGGARVDVPIRARMTTHPVMQAVIEEMLDTLPEAKVALREAAAARGGGGGGGGGGARGGGAGGAPALGGGAGGPPGGAAAAGRGGRGGPPVCAWPLSEPGVRCGFKRSGRFVNTRMLVKDRFEPTMSAPLPVAYVVHAMPGIDSLVAQLRLHGVAAERISARTTIRGEQFTVDSMSRQRPRDGHADVRVDGSWSLVERAAMEPGDYLVRTTQPLGVLAAILLEPQCDDGLTAWDYFNAALDVLMRNPDRAARLFPVVRVLAPFTGATRLVP